MLRRRAHRDSFAFAFRALARSTKCGVVFSGDLFQYDNANGLLRPRFTTNPSSGGYGPSDIHSAYNLLSPRPASKRWPSSYLTTTRDAEKTSPCTASHYGLPACTTAHNWFFKKENQKTARRHRCRRRLRLGLWDHLELDMVSLLPDCHILLVDANSATNSDLYKSVRHCPRVCTAVGGRLISNSYGRLGIEQADRRCDLHLKPPWCRDHGEFRVTRLRVSYPAASRYVTAGGGTSLPRRPLARIDRDFMERPVSAKEE